MVNSAGETVVLDGEWSYEVHPVAAGVDVSEDALSWTPFLNSGHAMAAGQAMARMHNAAEGYDAPARETRQLVTSFTVFAGEDPEQSMEAYLHERPLLKEYADKRNWSGTLHGLHMPLYGQLQPWLKYLRPLWTHNDLHASNLIWSDASDQAQVTGIIDFGLADRTNAVHDIATTIERNVVEWLRMDQGGSNIVHLNHLDALLAGYEDIRPLSYEDAQALVTMLPLVHCEFALSETDYFLSILQSEEKAFLAYEGYFVAHSQWFQGMQGQRLLEHMRRWADQPARHHALTGGER
jgi:Ser/Thr protein kinase RdoA (MazF antagonist)